MQHITGLDEMFLSFDTMTTNGNLGGISVFEGGKDDSNGKGDVGDRTEWLRKRVADRLDTLPPLRWRLTPVGMEWFWVEVPVDLKYHVTSLTLDGDGSDREMLDRISAIMSVHFDRTKPMWRLFVIEGLEGGRYAYFLKIAHGLADGSTMWTIIDHLSDAPVTNPQRKHVEPEGPAEIAMGAAINMVKKPATMVNLIAGAMKWMAERINEEQGGALTGLMGRMMPGELATPILAVANATKLPEVPEIASQRPMLMPPKSPFNGTTTRNVGLALCDLSVADLRRAGKAAGGTLNDALIAVMSGALREYMRTHGGIPPQPLLGNAPVSWRTGDEAERWANQIWMIYLELPTHIDDPLERLHYAHRSASNAKNNWDRLPGHLLRDMMSLMPGGMISMAYQMIAPMPADMMPALYNVSISNVRGPAERPEFDGVPIGRYFVHGFLAPSTGLLVGGQSLGDRMVLGITACRDLVKDYEQLPGLIEKSLEELLAAEKQATKAAPRK